jgi:hypothetical protein
VVTWCRRAAFNGSSDATGRVVLVVLASVAEALAAAGTWLDDDEVDWAETD